MDNADLRIYYPWNVDYRQPDRKIKTPSKTSEDRRYGIHTAAEAEILRTGLCCKFLLLLRNIPSVQLLDSSVRIRPILV